MVRRRRRAGASEAAIFGHVACKWIKANAATWIKWIPRVCPSGQAFLRDTGTCTPCPVGTASPDGKSCVACSDGELTTTIGAASCDFCPAGQWRVGSEAVCSDCPAGRVVLPENRAVVLKSSGNHDFNGLSPNFPLPITTFCS